MVPPRPGRGTWPCEPPRTGVAGAVRLIGGARAWPGARVPPQDTKVTKFRKGACENCGAMTHKAKFCTERPRLRTAKQTGRDIKVSVSAAVIVLYWPLANAALSWPCHHASVCSAGRGGRAIQHGLGQQARPLERLRFERLCQAVRRSGLGSAGSLAVRAAYHLTLG